MTPAFEGTETSAAAPSKKSPAGRPIRAPWRTLLAYLVALRVLTSYLWLGFLGRYSTEEANERRINRAHHRNARRIYSAIVELQGLYIKVGQLFSIMANFLPEAFRRELAGLQDQVPAREYEAIERRIRDEFNGRGPEDLFESFERTPIASASIGQVHAARLPGGRKVAVKVQYPDIEQTVRADLHSLKRIFRLIEKFVPYHGLDAVYQEIRAIVLQELDFTAEAQHAARIGTTFEGWENVHFPEVIDNLTTRRVITTEFVDGVKADDTSALHRMGIDRQRTAKLIIEAYCQQIFHHGTYHADPHPGNILISKIPGGVEEDPKITFIDFGAVAQISDNMRRGLLQLMQAAINRDTQRIVDALQTMGFIAHRADPHVYDRVIEYFHQKFQQQVQIDSFNLKEIRFDAQRGLENIADLRQMNISLGDLKATFHVPKEWIMLERTVLMIMGLCTVLDPQLNPMTIIRPHVERFVLGEDGDWSRLVLDSGRDIALSAIALPAEIKKFTHQALRGDLEVRVVNQNDAAPVAYALGHQIIFTAIGLSSTHFAYKFYDRGNDQWAMGCLAAGAFCGLLLLRSMWLTRKLIKKRKR